MQTKNLVQKFLEKELKKLQCLLEGKEQHYDTVLALFFAPFLNDTFNAAKGKVFSEGENCLSEKYATEPFVVPVGITLLIVDPAILRIPSDFNSTN